jgi:integrase
MVYFIQSDALAHAFPRIAPHFHDTIAPDLRQNYANRGGHMASFRKRGATWRAEVRRKGVSESASFSTKAQAVAWAHQIESRIETGTHGQVAVGTFGELASRYAREVSPTKDGARWEQIRIRALTEGRPDLFPPVPPDALAGVPLRDLDERHFVAWRDRRLRSVTAGSVRREWSLLSNVCTVAINEWRLIDRHPMRAVKRPVSPPSRERLATDDEIERLLYCLGYDRATVPTTKSGRVGAALLFAIETAMRAGEIAALHWSDVAAERRHLRVTGVAVGSGKTAAARREVPLSGEALRILHQLQQVRAGEYVFAATASSIDALFRKARDKAGVVGLTFHDFRHLAITRLAKRLDVLSLARMVGHRDLRMLMVYYNPSAEELAEKLR